MIQKKNTPVSGPHQSIPASNEREVFASILLDHLWARFRKRVSYVAAYETIIESAGAHFFNDHIAFRTLAATRPQTGVSSISRIFEALDYRASGCYDFPQKHLNAIHFQHPNPQFPKLFISELKTWELPAKVQEIALAVLGTHRDPISEETLSRLCHLEGVQGSDHAELMQSVVNEIHDLPWSAPQQEDVVNVNQASQYAAWVLVHGYNVNHFTSLINSHDVESLDDIEKTVGALSAAGVPMKENIEGSPGSKLRQTATKAVVVDVEIRTGEQMSTMPWTYAYFELAQRNKIKNSQTGEAVRFEGFLGSQATNLFEMTKKS